MSEAGTTLDRSLRGFRGDLTVADAAARSGLSLAHAKAALLERVARCQGHLAATSKGELLFRFPEGTRPIAERRPLARALGKMGRALSGFARLVVRAWVSVVVIGYAVTFGVALVAIAASGDKDGDGIGDALAVVGRIVFEALYWTLHPFSPFNLTVHSSWNAGRLGRRARRGRDQLPFYERVNRFVFGPPAPKPDPLAVRRRLLAEIRYQRGRIGLADVMRVTGLPRGEADALVSQLLLDFEGDVQVSDEGAIVYTFEPLRLTAAAAEVEPALDAERPPPFWRQRLKPAPITGNRAGSNLAFAALNSFNLAASGFVLGGGWTLERMFHSLSQLGQDPALAAALDTPAPAAGTAVALGLVPLLFSSVLFLLPLGRLLARGREQRRIEAENGRRAVAAHVLDRAEDTHPAPALERIFADGAGRPGTPAELRAAALSLGGDLDLDAAGTLAYRFPGLAGEKAALESQRAAAPLTERSAGKLVFSSDS